MLKRVNTKIRNIELKGRSFLSKYPLLYAVLSAVSIILFWKGVNDVAAQYHFLSGPILIVISVPVLVFLGLFLPFFVTDRTILASMKKEEDIIAREEHYDEKLLKEVAEKIHEMDAEIHQIRDKMAKNKPVLQ